jgi:hypothetical protein
MKKLGVALGALGFVCLPFATACSKDSSGDANPVVAPVDAALAIVDAGPTGPRITLDVANPSPRAWSASGDLLPAISDDGASVAILVIKEDGTRMYPNAALEIRSVADDKVQSSVSILEADAIVAAEDMPDAFDTTLPAYKKAAQAKLDEATALLAKTKWTALVHAEGMAPTATGDAGAPIVPDAGFLVTLTKPAGKLTLVVAAAADKDLKTPLLSQDGAPFVIAPRKTPKPQKGNPMCKFTPYVGTTAIDATRHILAVRIAERVDGNVFGCFEPSQWHVYSFAK